MSKKVGGIIYISSNREKEEFEWKIINDMQEKSNNLQIYSVTQKPMNLGMNKSIGDVGTSGFNFCRQLQMVTKMAFDDGCDYVVSCEADCLYSPDYFTFAPEKLDKVYRNINNYVLTHSDKRFYKKDSQTAFQIAGTKFLLDRLNYLLDGQPEFNIEMKNFPKEIGKPFLEGWDTFETIAPCFGIKTGEGMRKQTRHGKEAFEELPYWGKVEDIIKKFNI